MSSSLNNFLVEGLRQGSAQTVDALFSLGVGPSTMLDQVDHAPSDLFSTSAEPAVSTHSLWFWVHQAPVPDAARRCWERWVLRDLSRMAPVEARVRLQELFVEAVEAGLSAGQSSPLVASWGLSVDAAEQLGLEWSCPAATRALSQALGVYGDDAAAVLGDLHANGLVDANAARQWLQDDQGPWSRALDRGFPQLLETLCFVSEDLPAPVLRRLAGQLDDVIAGAIGDGPGSVDWSSTDRLLECRDCLVRQGLPATTPPSRLLSSALDKALASADAWPPGRLARFSAWRLEASLPEPEDPAPSTRLRF